MQDEIAIGLTGTIEFNRIFITHVNTDIRRKECIWSIESISFTKLRLDNTANRG
jgi:hypothetical protein